MATKQKRSDEPKDRDVRYLKRVWSEVDQQIDLPESLTGRALLTKLDGIAPPAQERKIRFSPKLFTWQSGITYAAAFVLIVALSTFLGRGDYASSIQEGYIPFEEVETPFDAPRAAFGDLPVTVEDEQAVAENDIAVDDGVAPFGYSANTADDSPENWGIGGTNPSHVLGQEDGLTYTYRKNDPSDPDKAGYPITVNVMDTETGELTYTIDVPVLTEIAKYDATDGGLVLVGASRNGVAVSAYSVSNSSQPVAAATTEAQGRLLDARVYDGVVHMLTVVDTPQGLDCEVVELPGADTGTTCIVTALNLETGATSQKAFAGASADATLYNLHAYINYTGLSTESNESGNYVAQIRLDGTSIELMAAPSGDE